MADKIIYPANGLEINFLGLPMVFNDGKTVNTLRIGLTNNNFFLTLDPDRDATITFGPETPVYFWFVVDEGPASAEAIRNWALTSDDALHDALVSLSISPNPGDWDIERSDGLSGNPLNDSLSGWKLTPRKSVPLLPGQSLLVTLSGLKTDLPDGPASGYCQVDMPHINAYGKVAKTMVKVIGPIIKSGVGVAGRTDENAAARPTITARADVDVVGEIKATGDLKVEGAIIAAGGEAAVESTKAGDVGPRLRIINKAGGKGSAAAIELSGYDTRRAEFGDIPAVRISGEDDGTYSGHLVFYSKGNAPKAPLTERMRLTSGGNLVVAGGVVAGGVETKGNLSAGGTLTTTGGAAIGGDIKSRGRVRDKSGDLLPVGTVVSFAGRVIPDGWLECAGQGCPYYTQDFKDKYGDLYRVLGQPALFKDGKNNDHFWIPDLRSRFIVGAGSGQVKDGQNHQLTTYGLNTRGGAEWVTLSVEQMPSHFHSIDRHLYFHHRSFTGSDDGSPPLKRHHEGDGDIRLDGTDYTGGNKAHENRPPYHALTYIIKF